uniref:NADH dehydrogenase subunit 4L n=1 Tax=Dalbulus maidis TaxID=74065 RepID=UPI0022FD9715|nr:NADH dehydrogenase subunit 4L [Dalbulus maidis]WAS32278.1 NADH dehydrogenase subunit 4L [Dalbulus maidis]
MFYSFMFIYLFSMVSLMLARNHIFLCLLSLEFIIVSLIAILFYFLMFYSNGFYLLVVFMVFFVCEGVLGLSILVSMIRCFGNDYMNSMSLW